MCAIRVWPSDSRCSIASRAPSRLSTCTSGIDGESTSRSRHTIGKPVLDEPRDPLGRQHEPVDERAVHVLRAQQAQVALLLLGVALGRAEQHRLVALQHELLDAADELGVERVRDVGQQQGDRLRRLGDQAARDRVRPVAELLRPRRRSPRVSRAAIGAVSFSARDTVAVETPGEARDVVDGRAPPSRAAGLGHLASASA